MAEPVLPTQKKSWWETLPGVITAVTGLVAAAGVLIATLHAVGFFEAQAPAATSPQAPVAIAPESPKGPDRSKPSQLITRLNQLPCGGTIAVRHAESYVNDTNGIIGTFYAIYEIKDGVVNELIGVDSNEVWHLAVQSLADRVARKCDKDNFTVKFEFIVLD